ncbi:MAG: cytochrome c [Marinosulfonomonas sp.]|nr:cytochrome c [Marinosulfonomonas sp.]
MNNKVIFGLGAVVVAVIAFSYLQSKPQQTAQGHSMTPPDTSSVTQGDPIVTVALPAELSANAQIGKRAFEVKCAVCHGENAAGKNGVAPPLVHKIYKPSHHSDMAFVLAAQNGVRSHHWKFGNMPPVKGLTNADVKYITLYVRELQKENGIN